MKIDFLWRGVPGSVQAEVVTNHDPISLGCEVHARDFPVCTAFVNYPRLGYRGLFGWVQLVRSTDNKSGGAEYEIDPFSLFGDAPSPYCWYGTNPTLFDAPSRPTREPMSWNAHSFLAATPLDDAMRQGERMVVPLCGLSWGFDIVGGEVQLRYLARLNSEEWRPHLATLRANYPFWRFADIAKF